ncbi:hypothetical protein PtB15_13B521 [Puccinia triticina]|nr:hypothetical protein PtB15_13B521 [Puccinia triticina]
MDTYPAPTANCRTSIPIHRDRDHKFTRAVASEGEAGLPPQGSSEQRKKGIRSRVITIYDGPGKIPYLTIHALLLSANPDYAHQQSTGESQQQPIEADINEYKHFVTLHSYKENQQTEHFAVVSKVVGIERLRNYHDDLEEILKLKSPDTNQEDVISQWVKFFQGYKGSFTRLKKILNLTDADHEDQIEQLVELAHFIRFPTVKEPSGMSQEEMLTRIQQSTEESRKSQDELTEFEHFKKLHAYREKVEEKFILIVEAAGGKGLHLID